MKHRIEIQANTETVNEFGERVKSWTTVITTKADILFKDGTSTMRNQEVFTDYKVDFRIRTYHVVDETMRVVFGGKKYTVEAVLPNYEKSLTLLKTKLLNE